MYTFLTDEFTPPMFDLLREVWQDPVYRPVLLGVIFLSGALLMIVALTLRAESRQRSVESMTDDAIENLDRTLRTMDITSWDDVDTGKD